MLIKRIVMAFFLIVALALNGCTPSSTSDSSMFRGNLKHTGVYDTKGPEQFHQVKWKFQSKDAIRSSPVIVDQTVYFGSNDQHFYAVDEATGMQKWAFKAGGAIQSSAAIAKGTAYFYSNDGKLNALNTEDGTLKWSYQTEEKDEPRDQVDYWRSSPAVSGGLVFFGGGQGNFYALNAKTGKLAWKKQLSFNGYQSDGIIPILHSSPAVDNGVVYMGISGYDVPQQLEPGNVVALDAKSGDQLWISPLMSAVDGSPVLDEHALYFGTRNGGIAAVDRKTGQPLWENQTVPYLLGSMALYKGTLFSGSSDSLKLFSLDAATGKPQWSFTTIGPIHASPSTDGTTVYIACGNHYTEDNNGLIYAVDAKTGEEKWSYQTGGNVYSSPALDQGTLFIGSDDGYLYAIN